MATAYHNLSDYDFNSVPDASEMRFGIVVSEWNSNITGPLLEGAVKTLKTHGAKDENILVQTVPGSFELTFGSAEFKVNGEPVVYDAPIEITNDRTMVPVRFVSEQLDCHVYWNELNKAVVISPKSNPWVEDRKAEITALNEMLVTLLGIILPLLLSYF